MPAVDNDGKSIFDWAIRDLEMTVRVGKERGVYDHTCIPWEHQAFDGESYQAMVKVAKQRTGWSRVSAPGGCRHKAVGIRKGTPPVGIRG